MRKFGIGAATALSIAVLSSASTPVRADGGATAALLIPVIVTAGITIGESVCKPYHGFFFWCARPEITVASSSRKKK